MVLVSITDQSSGGTNDIRISNTAATEAIAAAFLDRRDEVLAVVSELDKDVGDRYGDIPIEIRIRDAAKGETPWQFNFVLRGGWRRISSDLAILKDLERADLLLLVISASQIVHLDKAVDTALLYKMSLTFGRDRDWVDKSMKVLRERGSLLRTDEIRCPHIRYSIAVQRWFEDRRDPYFDRAVCFLRQLLTTVAPPLQGVSWLLDDLYWHEARRTRSDRDVLNQEVRDFLIHRCLNCTEPLHRRDALWVLGQLSRWGSENCARIAEDTPILCSWLENVSDEYAGAMASLLLWLWNFDREGEGNSPSADAIVNGCCPRNVADCVSRAQPSFGYGWGELLSRLYSSASEDWRNQFWSALNKDRILEFVAGFASSQLNHLSRFIQGLAPYDEDHTFAALERSLPAITDGLNADPLRAWEDIDTEITWSVLGYSWFRKSQPDRRQKKYARRIVQALPVERIASEVSRSRQRDWERYSRMLGWVHEVDGKVHHAIVQAIDLTELDVMSRGLWKQPPRELRLLISVLVSSHDGEPSRSWVATHEHELEIVDPLTTVVAPDIAINVLKRGGRIDLQGHNGDWGTQARALHRLKDLNSVVGREVACTNESHLVKAINELQSCHCDDDDIGKYLAVLQEIGDDLLLQAVKKLDPSQAEKSWNERLKERRVGSQRAIAILASAGSQLEGPVGDFCRTMLQRIPQRVRDQVR